MTLFIYEHLTSGALLNETFSPALMHEGDAMLSTLCQDLLALGEHVTVIRDARLTDLPTHPLLSVHSVSSPEAYQQLWQRALKESTEIILIAPETDGLLYQLANEVEQYPIRHLGSSLSAIALCSDKYLTYQQLSAQKVLTPSTQTCTEWLNTTHQDDAVWILKPLDGAGCEHTFKFNSSTLKRYILSLDSEQQGKLIIQPFIAGETLSLSLFISDSGCTILSLNRQHIQEIEHQLSLRHCEPGCDGLIGEWELQSLANQIHATIPSLWGFVGLDLILSDEQLWVIEINPRLTSSYAEAGFRQHRNPAQALHQSIKA